MITLDHLTRRFAGLTAVDDLSFEVHEGELFGLVGPDGAGKTTTLRMLAGVLRPTSGDARLDGVSVTCDPEAVKSEIAYMSQRFGLYADLTVVENLHFYADLYRVPRKDRAVRLERLFAFSGLAPFGDRLAGQLSGGMKQKLGLSCALIHTPKILLLDEPTFGVDPISRRDLWIIVHEMVAEGVTVIASTSYLDEAERFDRIAMLHRGSLVALDTPDDLLETLSGVMLIVRTDEVRKAREALSGLPFVRRAVVFGDRLHVTARSGDDAGAIERALASANVGVDAIEMGRPTLEDIFVDRIAEAEVTS